MYRRIVWLIQWIRERPLVFFILVHAVLFLAVFANLDYAIGNAGVEHGLAAKILDDQLPYRDFFSEYPPLALLGFLVPALFRPDYPAYGFAFAAEMLFLDLVVLFVLHKLARRLRTREWYVLGLYTLCLIAVGPLVTGRYDLLPTALVLVAMYAFIKDKNKTAWAFLALGATAKIFPVIIAPLFALSLLRRQQYRRLAQGIAVFGGVILVIYLPWVIISPDGSWQSISYHLERGLHIESSYGTGLMAAQALGLTQVQGSLTYGSWNLSSPLADALAQASSYVTVGLLFLAYALYARRLWKNSEAIAGTAISNEPVELLLRYSMLAILIMLLSSKLFSPQFLTWLCPFVALVRTRWRYIPPLLFLAASGITQYVFPYRYVDFEAAVPYLVALMAGRNFLLVAMTILVIPPPRSLSVNGGVCTQPPILD